MTTSNDMLSVIEKVKTTEVHQNPRDYTKTMTVGKTAHQGDLYVTMVNEHKDIYKFCKLIDRQSQPGIPTKNTQIAYGETVGSRHVAVGPDLQIFSPDINAHVLEGPYIVAKKCWRLEHPEHATHVFPAGNYVATYQLDLATMQRVRD
jgi:hypothetical protein